VGRGDLRQQQQQQQQPVAGVNTAASFDVADTTL